MIQLVNHPLQHGPIAGAMLDYLKAMRDEGTCPDCWQSKELRALVAALETAIATGQPLNYQRDYDKRVLVLTRRLRAALQADPPQGAAAALNGLLVALELAVENGTERPRHLGGQAQGR